MTINLTRSYTRKYKLFDKLIHPKSIFAFIGETGWYTITMFKKRSRYYR